MNPVRKIVSQRLDSVSFSTYSKEEILQLSVLEVKNSQSFNALGHPNPGGVYDPAFGPIEKSDLCTTCGLYAQKCPGHVGHISLPVLVYNPLFFKTLIQILRGSCFKCHSLLVPPPVTLLLHTQLRVLQYGLVNLASELENAVADMVDLNAEDTTILVQEKLKQVFDETTKGMNLKAYKLNSQVKNVVECRQQLIKNFLRKYFKPGRRPCPFCEHNTLPVFVVSNSHIILGKGSTRKVRAKKKVPQKRLTSIEEDAEETVEMEETKDNEDADDDGLTGSGRKSGGKRKQEREEPLVPPTLQTILTTVEAHKIVYHVWEKEEHILKYLFPVLQNKKFTNPMDVFFLESLIVPPTKFRPLAEVGDKKFDNIQSAMLGKVVRWCNVIRYILRIMKSPETSIPDDVKAVLSKLPGKTTSEKLQNGWIMLQSQVNMVVDSDQNTIMVHEKNSVQGVKQLIEKKNGLFRKHMMGKRVNYAARSVISPDPYINVDEIGIPEVFAKKLTYPQPVTPWNVKELRQAVRNGPDVHPGALLVENENGTISSLTKNQTQRDAIAKQLLTPSLEPGVRGCKVVYRHLKNGDVLLVNRQPTLHKPSIMAHKARILPKEKTIRLHYSNCKTYNADFDGDEMNVHFPQNELARAEAYNIANVGNQYLVPKDGTPLGGLIQDHMIAGVKMTIRGRFFTREDYQQLVYVALVEKRGPIKLLRPTIFKPLRMWSGKQVISTILINLIPDDKVAINLDGVAKVNSRNWRNGEELMWVADDPVLSGILMSESRVIFREGQLLCGVLDKAHYGPTPYGLIHSCYELYGGKVSGNILSALGRVFTYFHQIHGFTLGIEDILVIEKADKARRKILKKATKIGNRVAAKVFGLEDTEDVEAILEKYEDAHRSKDERPLKALDNAMKGETDEINNKINKLLMPNGLLKKFPHNNLQLMVESGAKGSTVNTMQISCLLGQIELEGRRPPLMMSGKTLPSFAAYDTSPRAGGFVDGRFLTGIKPQEFFFHCMAGREGLIDTAVKTSRSGYLQRCLIKHLEGVYVSYDMTVRDSDGSVVQFLYGEDGLDIQKVPFLKDKQLPFLARNHRAVINQEELDTIKNLRDLSEMEKASKKIHKWVKKERKSPGSRPESAFIGACKGLDGMNKKELEDAWFNMDEEDKEKYYKKAAKCPDPLVSKFRPDLYLGSVSERLDMLVDHYLQCKPYEVHDDQEDTPRKKRKNKTKSAKVSSSQFRDMMNFKIMRSLCEPGEPVGLLAAQSIGEPSTQMTLNTFHFAGRGDMNVTLGIPRMREILMTASANIATPSMEIPFSKMGLKNTDKLRMKLNRVTLNQLLEKAKVTEYYKIEQRHCSRMYRLRLNLLPLDEYKDHYLLTPSAVLQYIEKKFIKRFTGKMKTNMRVLSEVKLLTTGVSLNPNVSTGQSANEDQEVGDEDRVAKKFSHPDDEDGDVSSDEDAPSAARGDEDDATDSRMKTKHAQEREYEDPEAEEVMDDEDEEDLEDEGFEESAKETEGAEESDDALNASLSTHRKKKKIKIDHEKEYKKRVQWVVNSFPHVSSYDFDKINEEWCEITFDLNVTNSKMDFMSLLEKETKEAVVSEIPSIKRAIITDHMGEKILKTDGINIGAMFQYDKYLELHRLHSNDIHAISRTYGIEAAARAIVKEIQGVFRVYGIEVDPRHLLLIADYMTFDGSFKPFNRSGLESNTSPLQQMSFETTMNFLRSATLSGSADELKSPSAQLVVGKMVGLGTGSFDVIHRLV